MNLEEIAAQFRDGVEIKDRRYRFIKYRACFVGNEAVDFLIRHGLATTRDEAVVLGQSIMKEIGSFEHVTRDHSFEGKDNLVSYPNSFVAVVDSVLRVIYSPSEIYYFTVIFCCR